MPFAAGGPVDAIARIMAERMGVTLAQTVIVENVAGADGTIGVGRAARARPDGYTVPISTNSAHVLNGAYYSLSCDLVNDFADRPLGKTTPIIIGRKTFPPKESSELIVWLKANPNKASIAVPFVGARLIATCMQQQIGTQFALIPYRGNAPALQDILAGQLDLSVDFRIAIESLFRA